MNQEKQMLLLEQDYLDAILENCQDGVYITDNEANTVYLNHAYERISGLLRSEMIGKNMRDLVEGGVVSASGTLSVLENGESITIEQSFRTGKRAVITSSPVYGGSENGEHIIMVVTIVREITEIYSVRRELRRVMSQNREYASEIRRLKQELGGETEVVAVDEKSERLLRLARKVSLVDSPILISGEDGVGKATLARYMHMNSARSEFPFLRIDWSVMPREELAAYLFGEEDAQTHEYRMGVLESADGGTIYMEELTAIPLSVRDRILALLRNGSCVMGDGVLRRLDVRFVASSRYTFQELQENGLAETQLLQCFSAFPLEIAPLRERRDDIIPMADNFVEQYNRRTGGKKRFSKMAYRCLLFCEWPGNVRELGVLVQRAAIISEGDLLREDDLILADSGGSLAAAVKRQSAECRAETGSFSSGFGDSEKEVRETEFSIHDICSDLKYESSRLEAFYMNRAFSSYQNIRDAAASLGIDSSTFVRKRQRYRQMGLME
ncbi:MAG: sigma 54-interacting transcriptional regulator [Clostridiales bacterium]|nr:sigma 54-interacting transcriptional regulator [Clostridiales bacterium]